MCNFLLDFPMDRVFSAVCPSCCQEILIFTGSRSRSKYTYHACWSNFHSCIVRYLPAVGFPTPSRSTFSAVISSRGERDRSFSTWEEPRMVPKVFSLLHFQMSSQLHCYASSPVAALLGGLRRPSSGGKASGHGCSSSRPRSLPALTSWCCCSAFQEGIFVKVNLERHFDITQS